MVAPVVRALIVTATSRRPPRTALLTKMRPAAFV